MARSDSVQFASWHSLARLNANGMALSSHVDAAGGRGNFGRGQQGPAQARFDDRDRRRDDDRGYRDRDPRDRDRPFDRERDPRDRERDRGPDRRDWPPDRERERDRDGGGGGGGGRGDRDGFGGGGGPRGPDDFNYRSARSCVVRSCLLCVQRSRSERSERAAVGSRQRRSWRTSGRPRSRARQRQRQRGLQRTISRSRQRPVCSALSE